MWASATNQVFERDDRCMNGYYVSKRYSFRTILEWNRMLCRYVELVFTGWLWSLTCALVGGGCAREARAPRHGLALWRCTQRTTHHRPPTTRHRPRRGHEVRNKLTLCLRATRIFYRYQKMTTRARRSSDVKASYAPTVLSVSFLSAS